MRPENFFQRVGFTLLPLLLLALLSRVAVGLPIAGAPSRKLLEWAMSVFDALFDLVMAQTEAFQSESQLLIGAALVSGMVKALETAGTETSPIWVGVRRVFAILVASALVFGILLTSGGTLILVFGIAVSEEIILGSVGRKTLVSLGFTIPAWFLARWLLVVFTPEGPRFSQSALLADGTSADSDSDVIEPSAEA